MRQAVAIAGHRQELPGAAIYGSERRRRGRVARERSEGSLAVAQGQAAGGDLICSYTLWRIETGCGGQGDELIRISRIGLVSAMP